MVEFVQLATSVPIAKMKVPCIGQLKYNGTRCIAFVNNGLVTFRTRNNKAFTYPRLSEALSGTGQYVLDGELCFGDSRGHNHTKVSGIVNSSIHGNPIASTHGLSYNVFDMLDPHEFIANKCTQNYRMRYGRLTSLLCNTGPFIKSAKTWEFETLQQIQDTYEDLLLQGYEGMIIKHWEDLYEWKRSKQWAKLKAEKPVDLLCTGVKPGTRKYEGMIGSLLCVGEAEGKWVEVHVSGLTDAQRDMDESEFVGRTIEITYNEVIKDNATGKWSLFLPRFESVRIDK